MLHARQAGIIREARWLIRNSLITFHFVHAYEHKENLVHFNKLYQKDQLNVICDNMEKQELHKWISDRVNPTPWKPSHAWACWVDNVLVT